MCFGRRFYKRRRPPRLFFERALWREKRAPCCENVRFVMQTTTFLQSAPPCIWNMPFAANGVQSATLDPLGGQPKVVHDYWGQAFMKDCPFGGMGWEFRPTFLWPRDQPEDDPENPHVTFSGAARFLLDIFARLCMSYGQTLDLMSFESAPIPVSDPAAAMWSKFRHQAEKDKDTVPSCAAGAVGKHCFTTTSHIAACHLLQQAFLDIKDGRADLDCLRDPTSQSAPVAPVLCWPESIQPLSPELILAAPEHLHLMVTGILSCFNEMKLPQSERAGPPAFQP